jgi:heme A synthase
MVLVLVLSSAAANAAAVAVACTSWPLCPEGLAPAALAPVGPGYGVATVTAAIVAAVVGGLAWWRRQPVPLRLVAAGGLGLAALQGMVGGAAGIAGHAEWIGPVYLATLTLLLAAMLAVAVLATGVGSAAAMADRRSGWPPCPPAPRPVPASRRSPAASLGASESASPTTSR